MKKTLNRYSNSNVAISVNRKSSNDEDIENVSAAVANNGSGRDVRKYSDFATIADNSNNNGIFSTTG